MRKRVNQWCVVTSAMFCLVVWAGCGSGGNGNSSGGSCGKGEAVESSSGTMCVYSQSIIEEGFLCKRTMPHVHELSDGAGCSEQKEIDAPTIDELRNRGYLDMGQQPLYLGRDTSTNCQTDQECGDGEECFAKSCVEKTADSACQMDSDCKSTYVCYQGTCQTSSSECSTDADCGSGSICTNGTCEQPRSCNTSDDCPSGKSCQNGICQ